MCIHILMYVGSIIYNVGDISESGLSALEGKVLAGVFSKVRYICTYMFIHVSVYVCIFVYICLCIYV
jgi:hypothetical protein